jgi:NADH:ubiquinone oxidoreductase subunit
MGATLGTRILTWLRGEPVGTDAYGNRYYRLKGDKPQRLGAGRFSRERRWVIYDGSLRARRCRRNGMPGCITRSTRCPQPHPHHPWEKPHLPNLTGTPLAYHPPGSVLRGGLRPPATGDYEPWVPE